MFRFEHGSRRALTVQRGASRQASTAWQVEHIKRTLSMRQVVERYGYQPNRSGFLACPIHKEKTPSLKIYDEPGRGWHCFGCGAGGSVIDFVMLLFGISFRQAVIRMDADFCLGLTGRTPDPAAQAALDRRQAERAEMICRCQQYMDAYNRMCAAIQQKAPKGPGDDLHPEYVEALREIDRIDNWLDEHAAEVRDWLNTQKRIF